MKESDRLKQANLKIRSENQTTCCYALQDKVWVEDPDGDEWEVYGGDRSLIHIKSGCIGLIKNSSWNLNLDLGSEALLGRGCDWVRDYLRNSASVKEDERGLCDRIGMVKIP